MIGIFAVPCVIAWLIFRKMPADKDISVSLFGQVFKMDVKSSSAEQAEQPTEPPTPLSQKQKRPARRRHGGDRGRA
ncbi:hypothetical protein [Nocardia sp. NRRL S-836]|uniref:hypothetical protein n=1 Tax=Nocardia sp. NRRL S-836 TaxID=1519492 RepID=UPI0006C4C96E|nr:hypothetical protein [Nocardia sp. NRRL S-836]KOV81777.1 hypothetical protein ADL03_27675 [Nocardia sp. NRRL S-836]